MVTNKKYSQNWDQAMKFYISVNFFFLIKNKRLFAKMHAEVLIYPQQVVPQFLKLAHQEINSIPYRTIFNHPQPKYLEN